MVSRHVGEAATTLNGNCPDPPPSGLMTSTDQLCAALVKFTFTVICVVLKITGVRFGKVWPAVRSRNVTFAPLTKLFP
jgi:hypothetical protein